VLRTVPRDNEAINECWLSDRDRYSHEGLYAGDRATKPMIRKDGELVEASWEEAIAFVADGLRRHAGAELGALVAPLASCEEGWLLAKLVRASAATNIDHRLRTLDFADGAAARRSAMPLAQIEKARTILLVGSDPRHERHCSVIAVRPGVETRREGYLRSIRSISISTSSCGQGRSRLRRAWSRRC
jgi:NADH-quinone oxidoreductase subunit G